VSAAWMAHSHGTNDAQKTMGIITLALFTGTKGWPVRSSPGVVWNFEDAGLCNAVVGQSALRGNHGDRDRRRRLGIIRTLGHRVVKLQPVHGFAAETSAA